MASNGYMGKFSERLKQMRISRMKKKKGIAQVEDSEKIYMNFVKVMAAIPLMVYDNVFDKSEINKSIGDTKKNINVENNKSISNKDKVNTEDIVNVSNKRIKNREKINSIDVSLIKRKQNTFTNILGGNQSVIQNKEVDTHSDIENVDNNTIDKKYGEAKKLERKIINLIKKDLIKTVNELEILESELYILSEVNGDEKTLIECKRNIDEVKKILCKIDKLKNQYDFLKDNYDFEYLLEIDNNELVDNIIELKKMFDDDQMKAMVDDYKLLDVYKLLYLRIDQIHEDTEKFEREKENKILELKERDIDFEKLKNSVSNVDKLNDSYVGFVKKQNDFLRVLDDNVSKIDSYQITDYKLKGFGKYLFNSFKYLGLLMMSPLRGVVPSIATQTLVTKNVVSNLYNNIKWEEEKRMVYEAIDYSGVISNAISDLDSTDRMVDATLEDIVKLKMEYNDKFKMYQGDFSEYEEVIRKINDMENKILGNKIKIEIMKNRMRQKEKENENTLKRVRKLNEQQNI